VITNQVSESAGHKATGQGKRTKLNARAPA